jgi:hypothetical protein
VDRDHALQGLHTLLDLEGVTLAIEPIATLGESLQMHRTHISGVGANQGSGTIDYISVIEVDSAGGLLRTESFAVDRLDDATTRMHERYEDLTTDGR